MNKKPMILVGAAFAVVIIALIVYLILSLTTDLFKPTNEIYQKYLPTCHIWRKRMTNSPP